MRNKPQMGSSLGKQGQRYDSLAISAASVESRAESTRSGAGSIANGLTPRHGVVTLAGYGIQARVDRGHLLLEDGIGGSRRRARLPRVGHGLKRLVVIGSDGLISLAALRWLADQDASFVMLNRDGSVLATTGPVRSSDAKLRRAQAMAHSSNAALRVSRYLIDHKLGGQESVVRNKLLDSETAQRIAQYRTDLGSAETISAVRLIESQAAAVYWSAWSNLSINFPKKDIARLPQHWQCFGSRHSPLTGGCRLAVNPANAILNYLYALLESEARKAVATLGLDPGLGVLHVDTPARDSLACDVMEPIRPQVDGYVLDWITRETLSRDWFFEQRDGNCRLMAPFAVRLAETSLTWARAVAPFAEWVAKEFWATIRRPDRPLATRLTQRTKREARNSPARLPIMAAPSQQHVCAGCGKPVAARHDHCRKCLVPISTRSLVNAAQIGRIAAQSDEAQQRRAETHRRHVLAQSAWSPTSQPAWLNDETYPRRIQPRLEGLTNKAIAQALDVSMSYAADVRRGKRRPHPRHWQSLAGLVGISEVGG